MKTNKTLTELYSFPGFKAQSKLKGIFGDHTARIITLKRIQKKQFVPTVVKVQEHTTIQQLKEYAICLQGEFEFFLNLNNGDSFARTAIK